MTSPLLAEAVIPVTLGGREYLMRFTCNTMCAYEAATGKFFMDTVTGLYDVMFPKGHEDADGSPVPVRVNGRDIIRHVSMTDLRALLWASLHEYDERDEPVWPMTQSQVGRQLGLQNIVPVFIAFLTGVSGNSPTRDELGESLAEAGATPTPDASADQATAAPGGGAGIELPAGALD